ncbi:aspartate--tRNA(Asn) ligase [Nanoarchaeota archaeon]
MVSKKESRTLVKDVKAGKKLVLKGWVKDKRDLGKLKFLLLRDRTGTIQVTAHKNNVPKKVFDEMDKVTTESAVVLSGTSKASDKAPGGIEVNPESFEILSLSEAVLPIDLSDHSKTDIAKRLDWRFLDTRRDNISKIFKVRSKIFKHTTEYFDSAGFTNINTPKTTRLGLEGGATLFNLMYFGKSAFLAQSPQLYKQMFVGGGFERVYEIAPVFRAEKSNTTRHLAEFTGADMEMGFIEDENDIMDVLEAWMKYLVIELKKSCKSELKDLGVDLKAPSDIPRIEMSEAKKMLAKQGKKLKKDDDLDAEAERMFSKIVKEKYGSDFVFVTNYPYAVRPFYHMKKGKDGTNSFDLLWNGVEICTGAQREHRLDILEKQAKGKGIVLDPIYASIFKYGMPPHGGAGFGLDRMTQRVLELDNIREALLLTRDPERITP